jgi:hypothetical protein
MEPHTNPDRDDSLQGRMIRTARLDPAAYDEVKNDPRALPQATAAVLLAAVATGIGFGQGDLQMIGLGMLFALVGWYFTAYLSWIIGTRLFAERDRPVTSSPVELLRTIGFANSPGLLRLLAVIPEIRLFVIVVTTLWILVATVVAIRQGLGFESTARATGVYFAIQLLLAPLVLLFANTETEGPPH